MNRRAWAGLGAAAAILAAAGQAGASTDTTEASGSTDGTEATASSDAATATTEYVPMEPVTPGEDWPDQLVFTLTPSAETGGLIETAEPLAAMLSERLGGIPVEASVPTDYAAVIVALQSGQAQIAGGLGPSQMVQAEADGAELILQAVRRGTTTYVTQWYTSDPDTFCSDEPVANDQGLLFCNGVDQATDPSEGPIGLDGLAEVEGATVAFVDQGSTSGYQVPALALLDAGVDPETGVEALFAGSHDGAVQAVYDGDASVGVSFNDARTELVEQYPDVGEKVVVFGWSAPIPNDGFAIATDLPDDLKQAIEDAFVDISHDEEGAKLLDELYEIDGLVPVESADYDIIRDLEEKLGELLE